MNNLVINDEMVNGHHVLSCIVQIQDASLVDETDIKATFALNKHATPFTLNTVYDNEHELKYLSKSAENKLWGILSYSPDLDDWFKFDKFEIPAKLDDSNVISKIEARDSKVYQNLGLPIVK